MKALCWHGKSDMRYETVPDPKIQDPRDAIIKVTACAICGSDLHIFNGVIPEMEKGDIIGHETMGEVVEVGRGNTKLKVGDRVVVPFTISCGECFFCKRGYYSGCGGGPVGQFAIRSAFLLGAGRVIAIETVPDRMAMAKAAGAEVLDFMKEDIYDRIQDLTSGRGADACIDAVGTEPHSAASFD